MGAYFIFNDNSSYLTETIFGQSVMTSSAVMMVFGALCGVGALIFERLQLGSVLRRADRHVPPSGFWNGSLHSGFAVFRLFMVLFDWLVLAGMRADDGPGFHKCFVL